MDSDDLTSDEADGSSSDSDTAINIQTDLDLLKSKLKELLEKVVKKRKREEESTVPDQKWRISYFMEAGKKKTSKKTACKDGTLELKPGFYSCQWKPDSSGGGSTHFTYPTSQKLC
jgi:hypothetical protein